MLVKKSATNSKVKVLISKRQFSDFNQMLNYVSKVSAQELTKHLDETIEVDCNNLIVEVYEVVRDCRQFS